MDVYSLFSGQGKTMKETINIKPIPR